MNSVLTERELQIVREIVKGSSKPDLKPDDTAPSPSFKEVLRKLKQHGPTEPSDMTA